MLLLTTPAILLSGQVVPLFFEDGMAEILEFSPMFGWGNLLRSKPHGIQVEPIWPSDSSIAIGGQTINCQLPPEFSRKDLLNVD